MSKEAIIDHILEEANREAESIRRSALERVAEKKEKAEAEQKASYDLRIAAVNREAELMVSGEISLMRLEGKKDELKVRRELIDMVYSRAAERIKALPDKEYVEFISGLIRRFAEEGDRVVIANGEKRLTKYWLSDLAFDLQLDLAFANEFHGDGYGIILRGKKYDKNLTLSSVIKEIRSKTESVVAGRLFG